MVDHKLSVPLNFKTPFTLNVGETFKRKALKNSLEESLEQYKNEEHPILNYGLKFRNRLVKRFGFKTDFDSSSPYGPFKVQFITQDKAIIQYDDPHFSFYAELENNRENDSFTCINGVHYKTPQGLIYFWLAYPLHVFTFKKIFSSL